MRTCKECGVRRPNSEFPYREGTRRGDPAGSALRLSRGLVARRMVRGSSS